MPIGIFGKKLGMTQIFDSESRMIPVTIIEAGPCVIVQKKTVETDDYNAIQVGFIDKARKRVNKAELGHFDKASVPPKRLLREIRVDEKDIGTYEVGKEIKAGVFQAGDFVDVVGKTKGRGFTGVVKLYGFKGSKASHGAHEYSRHGGAIGSATIPGRVMKGKKMPRRSGNERVTIQNLKVIEVREDKNLLFVQGSVPGAINGMVFVKKAVKKGKKAK